MTKRKDIESLDWLWSDGYVDEIIDKLELLAEHYSNQYDDLRIDQREFISSKGLLQQAMLTGIANNSTSQSLSEHSCASALSK